MSDAKVSNNNKNKKRKVNESAAAAAAASQLSSDDDAGYIDGAALCDSETESTDATDVKRASKPNSEARLDPPVRPLDSQQSFARSAFASGRSICVMGPAGTGKS